MLTAFHLKQRNPKNRAKNSSYLDEEKLRREAEIERVLEQVLSVMPVLGLIFIGVGLLLHFGGRALNDFEVARVGVYVLLAGIALVTIRIFFWIVEEIVRRGLESMAKEK